MSESSQFCACPPDTAHPTTAISWIVGIQGASLSHVSAVSAVSAYAQPAVPLDGSHRLATLLPAWVVSQCCAQAGDKVPCSLITAAASTVTTLPGIPWAQVQ